MKRIRAAALLMCTTSGAAFADPSPEQVLDDAARYTVKIEVLSRLGLNQDSGGSGSGTGFLIDKKRGWIVTNAHVSTRSPSSIKVSFKGGDRVVARRIHVDPFVDVAILQIDPAEIPAAAKEAQLDCNQNSQSGSSVFAYGHPWGLSFTASRGIVSGMSWFYPSHLIQTDAAINSGNSGGPLISIATGKVIGINSSTYKDPDDENATAIGLAEPIKPVCHIVELLKQKRDTRLRSLPVALATSGDDLRPRVAYLYENTSGFVSGDIVLSINGSEPIKDLPDLADQLRGFDRNASVMVKRGQERVVVETHLNIAPDPLSARSINLSGLIISKPWRLDDQEQNTGNNLVVDWVDAEQDAGLTKAEASDIIVSVNGKSFTSVDALYDYLAAQPKGVKIAIILRGISSAPEYFREYKHVELTNALLEWVSPQKDD
jgi:serine protease Do